MTISNSNLDIDCIKGSETNSDTNKQESLFDYDKDDLVYDPQRDEYIPRFFYEKTKKVRKLKEERIPSKNEDYANVPDPSPKINIERVFKNNVPCINHDFQKRMNYMMYGDWEGQKEFLQLYHGDFSGTSERERSTECKIANTVGFFFGRNEDIVRYFMDIVPFDTHYESDIRHRKNLLEWATKQGPVYHEGVSYLAKAEIAQIIQNDEETTVNDIEEKSDYSKKQIQRAIDVFEAEKVINVEALQHNEFRITNDSITENYISQIDTEFNEGDNKFIKEDL